MISCTHLSRARVRLRSDWVVLAMDRKNIGAEPPSCRDRRKKATGTSRAPASASSASGSGDCAPPSQREMLELVRLIRSASATWVRPRESRACTSRSPLNPGVPLRISLLFLSLGEV